MISSGSKISEDLLWTAARSPRPPGDARAPEWCSSLSSATHITTVGQRTVDTKDWTHSHFKWATGRVGRDKTPKSRRQVPGFSKQSRVPRSREFLAILAARGMWVCLQWGPMAATLCSNSWLQSQNQQSFELMVLSKGYWLFYSNNSLQLFILSSAIYSQSPWLTAASTGLTCTSLINRTSCYLWKPSIKTGQSRPSVWNPCSRKNIVLQNYLMTFCWLSVE